MRNMILSLLAGGAMLALAGGATAQPSEDGGGAVLFEQPNFQGPSITVEEGSPDLNAQDFNDRARSGHFDGAWVICENANYRGHCEQVTGDVPDLRALGLSGQVTSLRLQAPPAGAQGYGAPRYGQGADQGPEGPGYDQGAQRYGQGGPGYDQGPPQQGGPGYDQGPPQQGGPSYDQGPSQQGGPGYGQGAPPPGDQSYGADRTYQGRAAGGAYCNAPEASPAGAEASGQGVPGRSVVFFARPTLNGSDVAGYERADADRFCAAQGLGPSVYFDNRETDFHARRPDGDVADNAPVLRDVLCRRE